MAISTTKLECDINWFMNLFTFEYYDGLHANVNTKFIKSKLTDKTNVSIPSVN